MMNRFLAYVKPYRQSTPNWVVSLMWALFRKGLALKALLIA